MYRLYLFHPGRCLVQALGIFTRDHIKAAEEFIKNYEAEEGVTLVRAILGNTTLTVLSPDEDLRLPTDYAEPTAPRRRSR